MTDEELTAYLEARAAELFEHFDSVQILASKTEQGESTAFYRGGGDWYSRQGMAHEFIKRSQQQDLASFIADELAPPSDESESWKEE